MSTTSLLAMKVSTI